MAELGIAPVLPSFNGHVPERLVGEEAPRAEATRATEMAEEEGMAMSVTSHVVFLA